MVEVSFYLFLFSLQISNSVNNKATNRTNRSVEHSLTQQTKIFRNYYI